MKRSEGFVSYNENRKVWVARITYTDPATGKVRNFTRDRQTKSEAKEALGDLRALLRNPEALKSANSKVTMAQLIDQCLAEHYCEVQTVKGKRIKGVRSYSTPRGHAVQAKEFFGSKLVKDCDTALIRKFKEWIASKPTRIGDGERSPSSIDHMIAFMKTVLNFGVEKGIITKNPALGVRGLMINPDNTRSRIYTFGEELALLATVDKSREHMRDLIVLAADTGMRRNELHTLVPKDINWSKNRIVLRAENTKSNKSRSIQMTERVRAVLQAMAAKRKEDERLITTFSHWQSWHTMLRLSGIEPGRWHDWRRVFLTRCVQAEIPLAIIIKQTGHASDEWERYLSDEFVEEVLTPLPGQTAKEVEAYAKMVWAGLRKAFGFERIRRLLAD